MNNNLQAFFSLVRAGLWDKKIVLAPYGDIDSSLVYRWAQEQSVIGLIATGLEQVVDYKVPQEVALSIAGDVLQLEQENKSMNAFIAGLIEKMRNVGIYTLLIKGQGIAQCYEKPLWRACGDIDLLLSVENYDKAKSLLLPLGEITEPEEAAKRHFAMQIGHWPVELHGTLHSGLSHSIDKVLDEVLGDVLFCGNVRSWMNDRTQVFLPGVNCDVIYVFSHIIQHFYKGGVGLRQICDWCRLLWTYRESLNYGLLESRIRKMGLMSEWKTFGAFAVDYLGMPVEAMPFYSSDTRWKNKADKICSFILKVGNFGHNRDMSFYHNGSYLAQKLKSFGRRSGDMFNHFKLFPLDTLRFTPCILFNGLRSAVRGE